MGREYLLAVEKAVCVAVSALYTRVHVRRYKDGAVSLKKGKKKGRKEGRKESNGSVIWKRGWDDRRRWVRNK
jgi:hypothetical protein